MTLHDSVTGRFVRAEDKPLPIGWRDVLIGAACVALVLGVVGSGLWLILEVM